MDFGRNTALKENYTFLVADGEGQIGAAGESEGSRLEQEASSTPAGEKPTGAARSEWGLYNRDTRFLSRYRWDFDPPLQTLLLHTPTPDRLRAHYALLGHHQQYLAVERAMVLSATALSDRLTFEVSGSEPRRLIVELQFDADFADLFEVRGWGRKGRSVRCELLAEGVTFRYQASDGLAFSTSLRFSKAPVALDAHRARFELDLAPGERCELEVRVELATDLEDSLPEPGYLQWREEFAGLEVPREYRRIAARAIDDLRALLLFTPDGPIPAAGIPWYVAAFGRDSLLTAAMLLPYAPQVARGTLRYLARHQGVSQRSFQAEEPGKIMHELRFGEMARTGQVPHTPYFGTIDATPLFLVLLGRLHRQVGDLELVRELRPHWEAVLAWMEQAGDRDGDGFLEFTPAKPGQGLNVQSWKDSEDSMSHSDGSLARGHLAVSEVQGYAFEAYLAASKLYRELGEEAAASRFQEKAESLRAAFEEAFWLEELGTYAMALDGEKRPLAVLNSDAGHLLWSGIVAPERAQRLASTLFGPELWSGWGFRTLGRSEARYNPVSYHNGSVWPHDTAIIGGGLARYGFERETTRVGEAVLELAQSQADLRLPELVAGYDRGDSNVPVPYPVACRPQAWDAAAVIYLLELMNG